MAIEYTEEQLNNFDKATLVQLFLAQQSQLKDIDQKLQLLLEQIAEFGTEGWYQLEDEIYNATGSHQ